MADVTCDLATRGVTGRAGGTIPALDGLRGLSALIVLVSHFSNDFGLWDGLPGHGGGQTGVMLFFVLSGFLMAHIHIDTEMTASGVWHYAVRRFARVYPMFVLVAVAFQMQAWMDGAVGFGAAWVAIVRQVTLIDPGFSILWTVRVEILFYVAFVGVWFVHGFIGRAWATVALLMVAAVVLSTTRLGDLSVFMTTWRYFLFGIISALLLPAGARRASVFNSCLSLLVLASLPLSFPLISKALFGVAIDPWRSDIVAFQVVLLFNLVARRRTWLSAALSTRAAREGGRISYSLYLLQAFVLSFAGARLAHAPPLLSLAIVLASAVAVAELTNRLIEVPAQRFILRACLGGRLPVDKRSVVRAAGG